MDLFIQGVGPVRLGQAEYAGAGGQAAVYVQGEWAYKVYFDRGSMPPDGKLQELAALTDPCFVVPREVLLDSENRPVGYRMRRVPPEAVVLCQLFQRAFRERHGIGPSAMPAIVRRLQEGVRRVHARRILIVDLHEMNFLVDPVRREVWFIDVDSYQTPGFPAAAIADCIRDRHAAAFSEETDWFAFAIVSFQLFTGIHPYRGRHTSLPDLEARMQANASVLRPEVVIPGSCYPFTVIPPAYLEWYRAVLEEGKRLPPPETARPVVITPPAARPVTGDGRLQVRELQRFSAEIVQPLVLPDGYGALTTDGLSMGRQRYDVPPTALLVRTPRLRHPVAAWLEGRELRLLDGVSGQYLPDALRADGILRSGERLYAHGGDALYKLEFLELPAGVHAVFRRAGNAMPNATQLFEGVAVQSVPGAGYVTVFPSAGECRTLRLPPLDGCRIVDARCEGGVLMVLAAREGRYDRFVVRFDERDREVWRTEDVPAAGLHFAVLDSGVCIHMNERDELELFRARPGSQQRTTVPGGALAGGRLYADGARLLFTRGDTLYSVTMRG